MLPFIKDLYLTYFTLFFRFARDRWSYHINLVKGVAGIAAMETVILMLVAVWVEIHAGTRFLLTTGKWPFVIASLILFFVNFHVLVARDHGVKFEREFSNLKKQRKDFLLIIAWLLLATIVVFFYYSIYAYHRFFHIVPKGW